MAWPTVPSFSSLAVLTAAQMNLIRDALNVLGGAWTPYTPTLTASTTNPTMGSSTLTGSYRLVGKTCDYRFTLTIGAGFSAGSGGYIFTLPPSTATLLTAASQWMGAGFVRDTSVPAARPVMVYRFSSTQVAMVDTTTGTTVANASPYTWATGDIFDINGRFETT